MVVLYRILTLLIAAAFIVGCAQSPTRPAPERQTGDASESVDGARASDRETDRAEGETAVEPVAAPSAEQAKRALTIRIGSQSFVYEEGDHVVRTGPISSGSDGYPTPRGTFSVLSKDKDKVSSRYTNQLGMQAWMPYAIQFYGHYFLHEGWLPGYPDSHGCVRVGEKDARFLFERMKIGDLVSVVD
ncbi:L,D-transpeptidase [Thiocapsa roseopersicina]|uniref:L,D-transpeptidase catalytic domain n=1 Tax=Thiocapsa roseopersicina TaxID=1058 RepID=A0A1H2WNP0_THIRO|nr:L,D-transpeptidase [Thiocapsa roseopersicina]SDW82155.1 L,D-transpeptidase catalytic domain [Thiocapsa roseopersicina]